jgi:hypothetical protein
MKNGLLREEVSLEDNNLVVFYFLSACDIGMIRCVTFGGSGHFFIAEYVALGRGC